MLSVYGLPPSLQEFYEPLHLLIHLLFQFLIIFHPHDNFSSLLVLHRFYDFPCKCLLYLLLLLFDFIPLLKHSRLNSIVYSLFLHSSSILFKKKKIIQLDGKVRTRLNHMRCLGHDSEFQYLPRFCTSGVPFALSSPDPVLCSDFKCMTSGISLVVQWLRLPFNSRVWV